MAVPSISLLPAAPSRGDPANFNSEAEAFVAALATLVSDVNTLVTFLNENSTIIGAALNDTTIGLTTPAAGKFTTLEADSLGGAAVQSTATDGIVGRLLKLAANGGGAFGLGATSPAFVADLDDHNTPAGFYGIQTSTLGTRPSGASSFGFLVLFRQSLTGVCQVYVNSNGQLAAYRTATAGVWDAWKKFVTDADILGTVSQSGGVPTGAVIERGSNANGDYVRFADGTQICVSGTLSSGAINNASGALFWSGTQVWTFPAAFASGSYPVVTGEAQNTAAWVVSTTHSVTSVAVGLMRSGSSPTGHDFNVLAIGRWF